MNKRLWRSLEIGLQYTIVLMAIMFAIILGVKQYLPEYSGHGWAGIIAACVATIVCRWIFTRKINNV